jgi:hypothetical protein
MEKLIRQYDNVPICHYANVLMHQLHLKYKFIHRIISISLYRPISPSSYRHISISSHRYIVSLAHRLISKSAHRLIITMAFILIGATTFAQEFKCKATVIAEQVQGVDPAVFKTLEQEIANFVNNRKWTNDNFEVKEKIECIINLVVNKQIQGEEGGYTGRISIQSKRPIYNTNYTSNLTNYTDKDVAFRYIQFQSFEFNDNRISNNDALASNLTALIAYYCYIMLGLDYDSFALKGGTEYFNKALNVVSNAPENKNITGWAATENKRNRFWLIDQMTNVRFNNLRDIQYKYHRLGLDLLSVDPDAARTTMNTLFPIIKNLNQENPSSVLLQFWFNAKSDEVINFLQQATPSDRQQFVPMLSSIDVTNAGKYAELLK